MQTEEQCPQAGRFLFADSYFSKKAIAIWKSECVKRCKNREKGMAYESYINWIPQKNEIAVFTLYAYADFNIPKKFDIIFQKDNPKEFLQINYTLIQCIWEAWFPTDSIGQGHKHLCIFSFDKALPDILNTLHKEEKKFSTSPNGQKELGFCNSSDFNAIALRIEKKLDLQKTYGKDWWEHDGEE